jgi:hypothetical protein
MHPLVQFGDAIVQSVAELRSSLALSECAILAVRLGEDRLGAELRDCPSSSQYAVSSALEKLWEVLCRKTPSPPSDPAEVFSIVIADRKATRLSGITVRTRGDHMAKHDRKETEAHQTKTHTEVGSVGSELAAAASEVGAAEASAPKHRPIPKDPKFSETSIISMCEDKDGKKYGDGHNPKKAGSASFERFAHYVDGMTVKSAIDAGLSRGDFDNDVKKGFITIV